MIEGAIECPPGSGPIVLGAEHPTTGGYPVVAIVIEADRPRLHRIPLGREVRFART
jgi:allophanate hydrolase subunit 2